MPKPRPPSLHKEHNRHGKVVWYFRKGKGPRTRIPGRFGSDEFLEAYRQASGSTRRRRPNRRRRARWPG